MVKDSGGCVYCLIVKVCCAVFAATYCGWCVLRLDFGNVFCLLDSEAFGVVDVVCSMFNVVPGMCCL